ncbi:MAG: hypothetical protein AB1714_06510 [Acidobacteriota bacterium]
MKAVVVVLRLAPSETHRFSEAVRLCGGLAAGGLDVTVMFEGPAVLALDERAQEDRGSEISEALGLLAQVGLRICYDPGEARTYGVRVAGSPATDALDRSRMREILEQAPGRIVFDARDEAGPGTAAGPAAWS